jgi:pimeloyl-ACP methyl ester carboxylesterase
METVTSADGTTIAFDRSGEGEGPPLLLIGGAFNDRNSPLPLAELLSPGFTVVRYDRRGRGDSGDSPRYAVEREIEDLAAVIGAVGGECTLYGHSSGGALALHAAAAGLPVPRLAIYEAPYTPDDQAVRKEGAERGERVKSLLAEGRRADAVIEFLGGIGLPPEMVEGMRHAPMFPAMEAMAPTLRYEYAVMGDGTTGGTVPAELLARVSRPALVLCGGASPDPMREVARELAAGLPDAVLTELPGQTHAVDPEVVAPVLTAFFTES